MNARSYRTTGCLTMKCQRRGQSNHPSRSPWHVPSLSTVDSLVLSFSGSLPFATGTERGHPFQCNNTWLSQNWFHNKWQQILSGTSLSGAQRKTSTDPGELGKKEVYKLRMAFKYVSMPQEPVAIKRDTHRTVSVLTQWSSPSMQHHQGE